MSNFNITSRYAKALIENSEEKNIFEKVSSDVELIFNTLSKSKELRVTMSSPVVNSEKKIEILTEIFSNHISQETLNFLTLVVNKKREDLLFEIVARFIELKDKKLGLVNVHVKSAVDFDESQKEIMKSKLAEFTNKKVRASFDTDESLIGGFSARFGDTVLDGSVKQQLKNLKKQLLA
ncbi:MAG: F0F1 ATP synthase subunit delta [Ignavibacteriae bacterium]|nr:F0F1 ATP synthase subunit delta [Ignavibacteriota bacterium]NOG96639.1 F0F1 ATP synthase subunit delta [Ignavibacteriota bacterium]